MVYIIIIFIMIFMMLILKFGLDIKIMDIRRIKEIGYDQKINKILEKFPDNSTICKGILEIINNNFM